MPPHQDEIDTDCSSSSRMCVARCGTLVTQPSVTAPPRTPTQLQRLALSAADQPAALQHSAAPAAALDNRDYDTDTEASSRRLEAAVGEVYILNRPRAGSHSHPASAPAALLISCRKVSPNGLLNNKKVQPRSLHINLLILRMG